MPITRCKDQSSTNQTLNEFYKFINNNNSGIGASMSKLIESLNFIFYESEIYALTSVHFLVLLSDNTWDSKWVLRLFTNGKEYKLDELYDENVDLSKPLIYSNETDFINKILDSMKKSGYWNDIPELK
jgi:hypothetical protein